MGMIMITLVPVGAIAIESSTGSGPRKLGVLPAAHREPAPVVASHPGHRVHLWRRGGFSSRVDLRPASPAASRKPAEVAVWVPDREPETFAVPEVAKNSAPQFGD